MKVPSVWQPLAPRVKLLIGLSGRSAGSGRCPGRDPRRSGRKVGEAQEAMSRVPAPQTWPGTGLPPWDPRERVSGAGTLPGLSRKLSIILIIPASPLPPAVLPCRRALPIGKLFLKNGAKTDCLGCVRETFSFRSAWGILRILRRVFLLRRKTLPAAPSEP